jgi:hypothetical protein
MSVYAIAQLTITDRAAYQRYQERFMSVMARFRGRLLAADENPVVVEGAWDREKIRAALFSRRSRLLGVGRVPGLPGNRQGQESRLYRGGPAGQGDFQRQQSVNELEEDIIQL